MSSSLRYARQPLLAVLGLGAVALAMGWGVTQHSKLALVVPLAVAIAASLLLVAEIGLRALWVWAPLAVVTYPLGGPNVNLNFGRVWIPGVLALLFILPRPRVHARASSRMFAAFTLLVLVLGIRMALTPGTQGDYAYGIRVWIDSMVLPLVLFAVVRRVVAVRSDGAERIAFSLMLAGLLLALIGIGERMFGFDLASSIKGASVFYDPAIDAVRISGPYEAPEPYGLALVLCLAATLFWLRIRPRAQNIRLAAFAVIALYLVALYFNYFRTGWISAVVVVAVSLGLRPRRFGRTVVTLAIVAAVLGLAYTELQGVSTVSTRIDNTQNVFARLGAYKQGIDIWEAKPWFGVGANQYQQVAAQLPPLYVNGVESVPDPHSSFVLVLAEDGVVGLLALLAATMAIWRLVHAYRRRSRSHEDVLYSAALAAAALAYLAYSVTLAMLTFGPSNQIFAAMLGIAAGRLDRLSATPQTADRQQPKPLRHPHPSGVPRRPAPSVRRRRREPKLGRTALAQRARPRLRVAGLRDSRLLAQGAGFAFSEATVAGLGAISTALIARGLSTRGFGSATFAVSFLLFAALFFDFGLFLPAARLTAVQAAADRARMIGAALMLYVPVGLLFSAAIFGLSFFVNGWFHVDAGYALRLTAPLVLLYPFRTLATYLAQGSERLHIYSVTNVLGQLLFVIALGVLDLTHVRFTVPLVLELRVAGIAISTLVFIVWLSPVFRGAIRLVPRFIEHARDYGFQVYTGAVLSMATYNMDVLMVGALTNARQVGYYSLAGSVAYMVGLPVYGVCKALFARLTAAPAIETRWLIFAAAIGLVGATAVSLLAYPVIPLVFSPRYRGAIELVLPLAFAEGVRGVTTVYNSFLSAHGRGRELRSAALVLTASNLVFNFALIPPFGALGAAWASFAALVLNLIAHVVLYRRSLVITAAPATA